MPNAGVEPLPLRLLAFSAADGELIPAWLSARDRPWLRDLLAEAEAGVGRPIAELRQRWARADPDPRAGRRAAIAEHVLLSWLRKGAVGSPMAAVRRRLFTAVAGGAEPDAAFATVAATRAEHAAELRRDLFAPPGVIRLHGGAEGLRAAEGGNACLLGESGSRPAS